MSAVTRRDFFKHLALFSVVGKFVKDAIDELARESR